MWRFTINHQKEKEVEETFFKQVIIIPKIYALELKQNSNFADICRKKNMQNKKVQQILCV